MKLVSKTNMRQMGMARHVRRGVDEGGAGRSYSGEKGVHHVVKVGGRPECKDGRKMTPQTLRREAWKIEPLTHQTQTPKPRKWKNRNSVL